MHTPATTMPVAQSPLSAERRYIDPDDDDFGYDDDEDDDYDDDEDDDDDEWED